MKKLLLKLYMFIYGRKHFTVNNKKGNLKINSQEISSTEKPQQALEAYHDIIFDSTAYHGDKITWH